jgi:hypothetical protein
MGKPVIGARSTLLPFDVNETQGSSFMQQRTSWRHPRMQPLDSTFSAICKLRNSSQCIYSYTSPHWSTLTTPRNQSSSYCFCLDTGRRLCRRNHHYSNPLRVRLVAALPHDSKQKASSSIHTKIWVLFQYKPSVTTAAACSLSSPHCLFLCSCRV